MAFTEKIQVILDVVADGAKSSLSEFRKDISDAEGPINKVKAAGSSMLDGLKANAGPAALAAGGALVAFGIKAVGAFTDTAKAAIDMGAATGLATEDASRWIAVGDDFGVTAEQLTSGIGKIAKSLDDEKWSKYGIATRDAAGQARNANDILIDSLSMLGSVRNETDRARIGNELFGKGYSNLAPLIGKTAAEYKTMLGAVEDGQVITESEAKKAEKMRLAQDALSDALGEVTLALGEMVAEMAPAIEQAAQLVGWMTKLSDIHIPGLPKEFNLMTGQITYAQEALKVLTNHIDTAVSPGVVAMGEKIRAANAILQQQREDAVAAAYGVGEYAYQAETATDALSDMNYQNERAAEFSRDSALAALEQKTAYEELIGALDRADALANLETSFNDMNAAVTAAFDAASSGAADSAEKTRDAEQAVRDHNREILEFAANVLNLPASRLTEIQAQIDSGQIAQVEEDLKWLARTRDAYINVHSNYSDNGHASGGGGKTAFGDGGFTGRGGRNDVAGIVHKGEYVIPAEGVDQSSGLPKAGASGGSALPMAGGGNVIYLTVNAGFGANGREIGDQLVDVLAAHVGRNGNGQLKKLVVGGSGV